MKFGTLKSVGHNIADSLASGVGMMIGVYEMDVFGEAAAMPKGMIEVDFLAGTIAPSEASAPLTDAVRRYAEALPALCERHGVAASDFRQLRARFSGLGSGSRFVVTVEDRHGRCATDDYEGIPGRRPRLLDPLGRIRRKPGRGQAS